MPHGPRRWCAHSADEGSLHGPTVAEVALRRVRPGEVVPPPPPELVQWGNDTLLATLLGMCYGGSLAYRARDVPSGDVSQQLAVQRNMVNLARASAGWGFKIGAFAAVFLGAQTYLKLQRREQRWTDAAVAGAGTAGLFGALLPSGMPARLRGLALGVGMGAGLGAPLGYAQHVLQQEAALRRPALPPQEGRSQPEGAAQAAISRLTGTD